MTEQEHWSNGPKDPLTFVQCCFCRWQKQGVYFKLYDEDGNRYLCSVCNESIPVSVIPVQESDPIDSTAQAVSYQTNMILDRLAPIAPTPQKDFASEKEVFVFFGFRFLEPDEWRISSDGEDIVFTEFRGKWRISFPPISNRSSSESWRLATRRSTLIGNVLKGLESVTSCATDYDDDKQVG